MKKKKVNNFKDEDQQKKTINNKRANNFKHCDQENFKP
jgi:hypothetical protein